MIYIYIYIIPLDLCVSSVRRGHANLPCIAPILTDDPRRESDRFVLSCFVLLRCSVSVVFVLLD